MNNILLCLFLITTQSPLIGAIVGHTPNQKSLGIGIYIEKPGQQEYLLFDMTGKVLLSYYSAPGITSFEHLPTINMAYVVNLTNNGCWVDLWPTNHGQSLRIVYNKNLYPIVRIPESSIRVIDRSMLLIIFNISRLDFLPKTQEQAAKLDYAALKKLNGRSIDMLPVKEIIAPR